MIKRLGSQTLLLESGPVITAYHAIVGKKEKEGPLGKCFEEYTDDPYMEQETWEKAEAELVKKAVGGCLKKGGYQPKDIDLIMAGDLLNQCTGTSFAMRTLQIPYVGLYGACSTMAESLGVASVMVEAQAASRAVAVTSSHFCTAEKQYRLPLEYGGQRPPTAQWTVTGSGAALVEGQRQGAKLQVTHVAFGKIEDLGIKDANNMGAAMAPAAASTIKAFLDDTATTPADYDLIATGDLGVTGSDLLFQLLEKENIRISKNHLDCGKIIFDLKAQDVHAGGSGCACSASVLCGHILPQMEQGVWKNILFVATGALMSPTSIQQGESIPTIAHLIHITQKTQ